MRNVRNVLISLPCFSLFYGREEVPARLPLKSDGVGRLRPDRQSPLRRHLGGAHQFLRRRDRRRSSGLVVDHYYYYDNDDNDEPEHQVNYHQDGRRRHRRGPGTIHQSPGSPA